MDRHQIDYIASIITEDPDILNLSLDGVEEVEPEGMEEPLTPNDIERQTREMPGENPQQQMDDQLAAQKEDQEEADLQRQQLLEPQIEQFDDGLKGLETDFAQGMADNEQLSNDATSEFSKLRSILGLLSKQL